MNGKKLEAPESKKIKFSPLEMEDQFMDGDHSHDEFNYRSQERNNDADNTTLIANAAGPTSNDDIASGGGDPHAHGLGGDLKSAVLAIVKGMVGPAILYLPHGFAHAGWVVAVPMLFASTALFLASSASLLECWEVESRINKRRVLLSKGSGGNLERDHQTELEMSDLRRSSSSVDATSGGNRMGEEFNNEYNLEGALVVDNGGNSSNVTHKKAAPAAKTPSYPDLAKKAYGLRGENLVKIGIAAMQSGVCLTYLIFVPKNMKRSCKHLFGMDVSTSWFLFWMALVQTPLSWIRDIRHLTITNALANGLIIYGLVACLGFAFEEAVIPVEENGGNDDQMDDGNENADDSERDPMAEILYKFFHLKAFDSSGWFLFIGTSVLLFEGSITLLIPLQEAVATPQDRQYFPKMYPNVILCIIWFYTFFGLFCWMSFGDGVETALTTSLPDTNIATTVQLAYSVAVMFTFPLQNFPSLEIACTAIESILVRLSASSLVRSYNKLFEFIQIFHRRNVQTSLLVWALAVVAWTTMNHLDKVVSLMGGLLGCPLAFVFPPMIHNKLASMTPGSGGYDLSDRRRFQNRIVAILGLGAMIVATVATIIEWNVD